MADSNFQRPISVVILSALFVNPLLIRCIVGSVNRAPFLPDKIFLTQHETAHVLSMSRQSVRNLVLKGVLHPVGINGQGLMRYRVQDLKALGRPESPPHP